MFASSPVLFGCHPFLFASHAFLLASLSKIYTCMCIKQVTHSKLVRQAPYFVRLTPTQVRLDPYTERQTLLFVRLDLISVRQAPKYPLAHTKNQPHIT